MERADLELVLEINEANVPDVGTLDAAGLAHLFDQAALNLVVTDTDGILGFCMVFAPQADYQSVNYQWFMNRYEHMLYLDRVAFDERSTGRGLGRALYDEVDRLMRAEHPTATGLTLEVNAVPPNERSLAFHAAMGFSEVGRQMSHGFEVSLMMRPVGPAAATD